MFAKVFYDDQAQLLDAYVVWHAAQYLVLQLATRESRPNHCASKLNEACQVRKAREFARRAKRSPIANMQPLIAGDGPTLSRRI
jgi:hypothetical protein